MSETLVATSISRRLMARMEMTHLRQRISIFSGPPGIGKTSAIEAFAAARPQESLIVKVSTSSAGETRMLQHLAEALCRLGGANPVLPYASIWWLRKKIYGELYRWQSDRAASPSEVADLRLTIIVDEAQNLSRKSIEALRYWNDPDRCYGPFPIGIILVGNSEFALRADQSGESVISAAVADRALFVEELDYDDVLDDDLCRIVEARLCVDRDRAAQVVRKFNEPQSVRSLRRLSDFLDFLDSSDVPRASRALTGLDR